MKHLLGLPVKKPVSLWNREIEVNFKDLFKNLGKAIVSAKVGVFDITVDRLFDSIDSFKFKEEPEQLTWLLIYRSILAAISVLIKENLLLIQEANRGFQSLATKTNLSDENLQEIANTLDYEVEAKNLVIEQRFFENPKELSIIKDIKKPFAKWLENFGLNSSQAHSISERFPSYFVFALNEEWRKRHEEYEILQSSFNTPFTKAAEREQEWNRYYAWLQKRIDEPMFQEAFGLRQIYIPLRAYFEVKVKQFKLVKDETEAQSKEKETENIVINRIVVNLEDELESWINNSDKNDGIRIVSGGPGYGKSSLAKMFAAKLASLNKIKILFVPLHLFEPSENLLTAIDNFISQDNFLSYNPLTFTDDSQVLLIFDGLDELSMQGKIGAEIAQLFILNIQNKVNLANQRTAKLKVLILGRELSVQSSVNNYDTSMKILHLLPYFVLEKDRKKYIDK
ncbi:MAG TPA: hypothetical protein VK308_03670 [Pyrinomonadaceae bacterium]|nr:hypothetical protein [Pyrinomonadaceae bacterium]